MEGLPAEESGLGVGALEIPGGQSAVSSSKRHHTLGVNLLFWRDKGRTSCRGSDLWPHPITGRWGHVQGRNDPAEKHALGPAEWRVG